MGACEIHSGNQTRAGDTAQRPAPHVQYAGRLFLAFDDRPPLAGLKLVRPCPRLPARRCGRSSLTPGRATAQTGSNEEKPQPQSRPAPPGDRRPGHRANSARPLDNWGPHGCGHSRAWRVPGVSDTPTAGSGRTPAFPPACWLPAHYSIVHTGPATMVPGCRLAPRRPVHPIRARAPVWAVDRRASAARRRRCRRLAGPR